MCPFPEFYDVFGEEQVKEIVFLATHLIDHLGMTFTSVNTREELIVKMKKLFEDEHRKVEEHLKNMDVLLRMISKLRTL